ncbi:MAG: carbohydrate-binding protein [Clostridia bacterium]|nr:carbohydrate-binding protein [Clostridia bacterium]
MGIFFDDMLKPKDTLRSNCDSNAVKKSGIQKFMDSNEQYSADISDGVENNDTSMCLQQGVEFHDLPDMIKMVYNGLLAKSGAQEVYAVMGYGTDNQWEEVQELPMQKTAQQTFELLTFRKRPGDIHFAFRDNTGNWDNNSGKNYTFYRTTETS